MRKARPCARGLGGRSGLTHVGGHQEPWVVALKTGCGFTSSLSPPGTMVVTVQMSGITTAFSGFRQKVLPHKWSPPPAAGIWSFGGSLISGLAPGVEGGVASAPSQPAGVTWRARGRGLLPLWGVHIPLLRVGRLLPSGLSPCHFFRLITSVITAAY